MIPMRAFVIASLLSAAYATTVAAQTKKTLIVAEPVHGTGYLPLYVAIRNGYFAKDGLDVKVLTVDSGAGHTNAVLSGQAFAFIGGPEHDAFAKLKGGELRSVVNVVDRGNVYYVARKGMEPAAGQSMADYFKHKSIAVSYYGGTPNSITRYLLKTYGLDDKKDVTLQEMANGAVLAAVKSGNSVIGVTTEPLVTQGIRINLWGEPFLSIPKELGPYAYSTLNVREESIEKDPDTVRKFVKDVILGLKYTYDNPAGAAAIAKEEFPTMSAEDLKATLDRSFADQTWSKDGMVSRASWKTARSVVLAAGILKKSVPYDAIINMQFVNSVNASKQP